MHFAACLSRGAAPAPPSADLLTRLRDCTRERHARLDASLALDLENVTAERYGAFLRGLLAVVAPLEGALARWFSTSDARSRGERLRQDLERLGSTCAVASFPIPLPANIAEAFGAAYVLEGSALGGIVLAPKIEEALGNDAVTSYLRFRGERTGRAWRAWLDELHRFGKAATEDQMIDACEMARAMFDAYTASLRASDALMEHRT